MDGLALPSWGLYAGVVALGVGLAVFLVLLVPRREKGPLAAEDRVTVYTQTVAKHAELTHERHHPETSEVVASAKTAAAQLLRRNAGLEARIAARLDQAGSDLKPAEWLLLQAAIAVVAALLGLLLGRGNPVLGFVFLVAGILVPWLYLGVKRTRRRKAFDRGLPDTLQLISGSLAAGLSLPQAVDTVVRDGVEPISSEFRRVLIETRLGVQLEDAFDGLAERFESKDFAWIVMAIRIQRQVGGNLAELLDTVAATMREREYMRRQVATLSAEGRLSAWILGLLPPGFVGYLFLANRTYVMPLVTDVRGIAMLVGAAVWLSIGVFWMSRMVKVEV
ncbi:type II secretion system F family protein [Nocardioides sp.]|uniref:type II secretion system F family protein n=1 Tax=Nocardioides sp. TaxID=35761 RepID=UPI0039E3657A